MTTLLSFRCGACDLALPDMAIPPVLPDWASFAAFDTANWSSDPLSVVSGEFSWDDPAPMPGREYFLQVHAPFSFPEPAYTPWILYRPANSAWNGWDDAPEEIPLSSFVRIGLIEIISVDERTAWLKIRALETRALPSLVTTFEPHPAPREMPQSLLTLKDDRRRGDPAICGDFAYLSYSAEGDLGEWAVCHRWQSQWRLILFCNWDFHSDVIYAGHRFLNEEEADAFGLV